jgi:cytochrome c-type biogenesis protein CcmE
MAKRGKTRWWIGGSVIAAAVVAMAFLNLSEYTTYFLTPSEAYARAHEIGDQTVKVGGMVKVGSVKWHPETLSLDFVMNDMDEGHDIAVSHKGTPPDMFKEGSGVVVEGRLGDGGKTMQSRALMVKHSEEYKQPGDPHSIDKALLEKSMFKGTETKTP